MSTVEKDSPPHAAFATRIRHAAVAHPFAPPNFSGQQTWLVAELDKRGKVITRAAVNKWFNGHSYPRPAVLPLLAEILRVDTSWLAVGGEATKSRGLQNPKATGAVLALAGLLQMSDISCAFPSDDDPNGKFANLIVIVGGRAHFIFVTMAPHEGEPVHVPIEFARCRAIMVQRMSDTELAFYELPRDQIAKFGEDQGGSVSVRLSRSKSGWLINSHKFGRIDDFRATLDTDAGVVDL